jgi:hypothetical protein
MAVEGNLENNSIFVSQSDLDNALSIINEAIQSDKWNQKSLQQINKMK